jgi:hypothetical protein
MFAEGSRGAVAGKGGHNHHETSAIPAADNLSGTRKFDIFREIMAEGKGFEPPKGISSFNDLANRRLQPLGHPPAGVTSTAGKILANAHVHNTRRMLPFL